jgi:O-antigen/teichoic acid export membrane protein
VFSKAQGVLAVFRTAVLGAVSPVLLPLYASQARAGQAPDATFLRTVAYLTACAWPFFAVAAAIALPLARTLYGHQWDAAAPLIRILCLATALYSMGTVSRYLFIATGHVRLQARLDALAAVVRIGAVTLGAWHGLEGAAWALLGAAAFRTWLTCRYLRRASAIGIAQLARSCAGSAALALGCGAAAAAMAQPERSDLATVLAAGGAAGLAWVAGVLVLRHPLRAELLLLARRCGATLFA